MNTLATFFFCGPNLQRDLFGIGETSSFVFLGNSRELFRSEATEQTCNWPSVPSIILIGCLDLK